MKCGPDGCPILAYTKLTPTQRRAKRKQSAEAMAQQGFSPEDIAKQLKTSLPTIYRDLEFSQNLENEKINSPAKTPRNPKGAGRPKGKKAKKKTSPERSEPRLVHSQVGPLRELAPEQVDPNFSGDMGEFKSKWGHHQSSVASERSQTAFTSWAHVIRMLVKAGRTIAGSGDHNWPSDGQHWIEHLDKVPPERVAKLAEDLAWLRPKLAFAEALLARAREIASDKKRA
jgi:hypothetical protein